MESEHYTLETRDSDFGYHGWCPSNLNFEESIFPVYLYTSPWRSNTFRSHARSALSCLHLFEKLGGHQRNEQNDVFPSSQFWEQNAAPPIEDSKILKKHVSWGNHKDNMIMILSYKFIRCSIGIGKIIGDSNRWFVAGVEGVGIFIPKWLIPAAGYHFNTLRKTNIAPPKNDGLETTLLLVRPVLRNTSTSENHDEPIIFRIPVNMPPKRSI